MKQTKLPVFSRDLKLKFHMNQQQPSDYKHLQSNQDSPIYIPQTINADKKNTPCSMTLVPVIWCPDIQLQEQNKNHLFLYQLVELGMLKLNQTMVFFK